MEVFLFGITFVGILVGIIIGLGTMADEYEYGPYRAYTNIPTLRGVITHTTLEIQDLLQSGYPDLAQDRRKRLHYYLRRLRELEALDNRG